MDNRFEVKANARMDPIEPRAESGPLRAPDSGKPLDLTDFPALIGDPAEYFIHDQGPAPLVVRHADGMPVFAYVEGKLIRFDEYRRGK